MQKGKAIHYLPPYRPEHKLKLMDWLGIPPARQEGSVPFIRAVIAQRNYKSAEEIVEIEKDVYKRQGLVSFSALFGYNPVAWLCLFILIAGILGSARIILGHHTLGEVLSGFTVGLVAALLVLHPVSNLLFRVFLF